MLRLTPGSLNSQRLDQRPAGLPTHLFVHGGLRPTRADAVIFYGTGPVRTPDPGIEALASLQKAGTPLWLRLQGLGDRRFIQVLLDRLAVPPVLLAPLLEVPQRPRVNGLEDVLLVVLHRLSFAQDPAHLVSEQVALVLRQRQRLLGAEALEGFRDMAELVDQLFEACGSLRGQCDAITQSYAASIGNRMNQVMKTLTILTSIFAPLTFIAGIYGMNFEFMPELKWHHGYVLVMLLMLLVASLQAWWLWRRGWFQDWTGQG